MEFDPPMNSSSYAYYLNSLTGMANPSSHPLQLRPKAWRCQCLFKAFPLSLGSCFGREKRYSAFKLRRKNLYPPSTLLKAIHPCLPKPFIPDLTEPKDFLNSLD
jgi:hypothetical protein